MTLADIADLPVGVVVSALLPLVARRLLSPMLAGAAMAFSSVVVSNSLHLRGFRATRVGGSDAPSATRNPRRGGAAGRLVGR
ncbi:hypothetical protein [Dactylosporangium salmoneum]|uniref:hypothetical protein n=1 Tax=Dactylosporangium salmoneum TaxID=53361 RepID=UPI0031CEC4C7